VVPSLHSCLFAASTLDAGCDCLGDLGMSAQDRHARTRAVFALMGDPGLIPPDLVDWFAGHPGPSSSYDGGQLAYLLTTPAGAILVSGSSGCWTPLLRDLRPDVAILAASGRPNVDGEPYQGSLAGFIADEVEMLHPTSVVLCHHDALLPPLVGPVDVAPIDRAIADRTPAVRLLQPGYGDRLQVLR
jgi:hypothetical protein